MSGYTVNGTWHGTYTNETVKQSSKFVLESHSKHDFVPSKVIVRSLKKNAPAPPEILVRFLEIIYIPCIVILFHTLEIISFTKPQNSFKNYLDLFVFCFPPITCQFRGSVSFHLVYLNTQKITNLWKFELNWSSKLRENNVRKIPLWHL